MIPQIYLHIDMVLSALIAEPGAAVEKFMAEAEEGKHELLVFELAFSAPSVPSRAMIVWIGPDSRGFCGA
jgi:hypothetical protein